MASDHYSTLGVDPAASQTEIKQAYRALARQYHPDRNPGDDDAVDRFKQAAEAYRVLSDAELRAQYDAERRGSRAVEPSAGDFLDELFGTRRSAPQARVSARRPSSAQPVGRARPAGERGADLRYTLSIALEESAHGSVRTLELPGHERCGHCGGTGARPGSAPLICGACSGSGEVTRPQGFFSVNARCEECAGSGRLSPHDCRACDGTGLIELSRSVRVEVPPGVVPGTRLRLAGEGAPGSRGGAPGDLYVVIEVEPHPLFEREGADLLVEVPITFAESALGAELEIPTLEGPARMRVPAGSQSGRVFRLAGKGFPDGHGGRGDQRVRVIVETPSALTEAQRVALNALADADAQADVPRRIAEYQEALARLYQGPDD